MRGVINSRDVLTHLGVIWREFGFRCAARCAWASMRSRPTTFLDLALKQPRRWRAHG